MSYDRNVGTAQYLKKGIKKNPKYDHIKTKIDTGCRMSKFIERDLKNLKIKHDELFKRMKISELAKLILQVASIADMRQSRDFESSQGSEDNSRAVVSVVEPLPLSQRSSEFSLSQSQHESERSGESKLSSLPIRSSMQSVVTGVGEHDISRDRQRAMRMKMVSFPDVEDVPYHDSSYLLLDVREREQYDSCHIISAYSYPIISLCRTMNPYTKEVLDYKNATGKVIILYDEDERIATQAATTMCQRGFDNLYVLNGGLKTIARKFPVGMTTGSFPPSCIFIPLSHGKKVKTQPPPPQPAERRWRFTPEELSNIQQRLEEMTAAISASSSRTSSTPVSTASRSGSQRSSSSTNKVQSVQRHWK